MILSDIQHIYFLGIGGIGMSALARYFLSKGIKVSGYDKTPSLLTRKLKEEGARIVYEDKVNLIPTDIDFVVFTPAIPADHNQLNYFITKKYPVYKRAEVLGALAEGKFTIAVAGSHGKTTVTSLIAHILTESGQGCTAFVGGIMLNYDTNFISGNPHIIVAEADEFDRSFLKLSPDISVITAVDTDHLDIYGTKEKIQDAFLTFASRLKPGGLIYAESSIPIMQALSKNSIKTYALDVPADIWIPEYQANGNGFSFLVTDDFSVADFTTRIGGKHNMENALPAIAIARLLGINDEGIAKALRSFIGLQRRFQFIAQTEPIFIDDYAHHPAEISAFLSSVRSLFPDKKITAIFQPHLFSRTRDLFPDFATSLSLADTIILLDIYPAREEPLPGITSQLILDLITKPAFLFSNRELMDYLRQAEVEVVVTIGAGDIDRLVEPIYHILHPNLSS